jgi:hypothetical protein
VRTYPTTVPTASLGSEQRASNVGVQKVEGLAFDLKHFAVRVGLAAARTVLLAPLIVIAWTINKVIDLGHAGAPRPSVPLRRP